MADNYLERHREEYELRKMAWLKGNKSFKHKKKIQGSLHKNQKPEDESL